LRDDALKSWQQRSWIFARDPMFGPKAGRVLDLYERRFEGRRLHPGEFVISADEKSQRRRLVAATTRLPRALVDRRSSSLRTAATARSPTSPRGTCITPACSGVARPKPGSSRSAGSSSRS
jgi:hypothetical protein